jgi:hypothetical protein
MKNIVATAEKHIQAFSDTPKSFINTKHHEEKLKMVCFLEQCCGSGFNADQNPAF